MNLFAIGWARRGRAEPAAAELALRDLVDGLSYLESERVESWTAPSGALAAAWVTHRPEHVGGVRYVAVEPTRLALFSGRPIRWRGDADADGRTPLDPGFYHPPASGWAASLDGRFVAVTYEDERRTLEICTDALGAYPVYAIELGGVRWISNSAELLRSLLGATRPDRAVLASMLGGGWSLTGDPVWQGVRRVPPGLVQTFRAGGGNEERALLPPPRLAALLGVGFDAERSARTLVAAVSALADWPGRPMLVQLSGGLDSRLVLAACLEAGIEFEATTAGPAETLDAQAAALLCSRVGIPLTRHEYDPYGALFAHTAETARILALLTAGTACLADVAGFVLRPLEPLPLWLGGQAGEIARSYYGVGTGLDRKGLLDRLVGHFYQRSGDLLSAEGRGLVERQLREAVDEQLQAGMAAADVPEVFYARRRLANWAGQGGTWVEYGKGDSVAPFWSSAVLRHEWGPTASERAAGRFHRETLERLAPSLADIPLVPRVGGPERAPTELFAPVVRALHAAVRGDPGHHAWPLLDRPYVEWLLGVDPLTLDPETRHWGWKFPIWKLATVFLAPGFAG